MIYRSEEPQDRLASAAFIKRLEEIGAQFRSRAAFAEAAKIPASSLQSYFEGSEPNRLTLVALADAGRVSLEWLTRGRGYKEPHPEVPDGYVAIPFYDIRKAGGYVYPMMMEEVAEFAFLKLEWFEYGGIQPGKLFLIEVTESLVPEIHSGEMVVADKAWGSRLIDPTAETPEGLYLVSQRAKLSIRRILSNSNGNIELSDPRGKAHATRVKIGDQGFFVHGRIIWHSSSLPPPASQKPIRANATRK
jgi:hypothetical protein